MAFPVPPELVGLRPLQGVFPAQTGRNVRLGPDDGCQSRKILKLENGSIEGESVGIHFSVVPVGPPPKAQIRTSDKLALLRGSVTFGIGDSRQTVDLDLAAGAALSVQMQSLQVVARYDVLQPPWSQEDPCDTSCLLSYNVGANVGYGGVAAYLTYTEVAFLEDVGDVKGRALVPIPPFARSFTVLPSANATVAAHLRFPASYYDIENVIVTPLSNAGQSNRLDQLPVVNGQRWVELENRGSSEHAVVFVVFGIWI